MGLPALQSCRSDKNNSIMHRVNQSWSSRMNTAFPYPKRNNWLFSNGLLLVPWLTYTPSVCPGTASEFQPSGFRPGLPAAHLPTDREDRRAAGDQPPAAEADLRSTEGRQDDKDQRGVGLFCHLCFWLGGGLMQTSSRSHILCGRGGVNPVYGISESLCQTLGVSYAFSSIMGNVRLNQVYGL